MCIRDSCRSDAGSGLRTRANLSAILCISLPTWQLLLRAAALCNPPIVPVGLCSPTAVVVAVEDIVLDHRYEAMVCNGDHRWQRAPQSCGELRKALLYLEPGVLLGIAAVSYTHLDVYKRQEQGFAQFAAALWPQVRGSRTISSTARATAAGLQSPT